MQHARQPQGQRVKAKQPIHLRDPLFAEVFRHTDKMKLVYEKTEKGTLVPSPPRGDVLELLVAEFVVAAGFAFHRLPTRQAQHVGHDPPHGVGASDVTLLGQLLGNLSRRAAGPANLRIDGRAGRMLGH